MAASADVMQGTLDLLVLKALSLAPLQAGASASESSSSRAMRCRSDRARSIPRCTASNERAS